MIPSVNANALTLADPLEEAGRAAVALLRRNLGPAGIMAATPGARADARNYSRIFGRDAAICALGMAVSGEEDLIGGAERGLVTLAEHQATNGQIPNFVEPASEDDFWYLGCIDATLWWLIAVDFLAANGRPELRHRLRDRIGRALEWATCQEHPRLHLVQQNEASDWADIMPRSGFVLYSNALWYRVKQRYALPDARATRIHFNQLFFPFARQLPDYRRLRLLTHFVRQRHGHSNPALYLSFVDFGRWGEEGDVFGNLLAILFGLADDGTAHRILRALRAAEIDHPVPVRAVCSPIARDSPLWRCYMGRHRQNLEFRYHNGGAWPFLGGFWSLALAATGHVAEARAALLRVAEANGGNKGEFNEWFDGRTGEAQGMAGQSWNAALLLLARQGLAQPIFQ